MHRPDSSWNLNPCGGAACRWVVCSLWFIAPLQSVSLAAEYRLKAGEVLEIQFSGLPELNHRATVDLNGQIAVPLVGELQVAGRSVSEVRKILQDRLPMHSFRKRTPDGREMLLAVLPEEITVSVAEYRQVYVGGDVARPGEQVFRPGMIVRQAIYVAGGFDLLRLRTTSPVLEAVDLRGQHDSAVLERAREQAHVARLKVELGDSAAGQRLRAAPGSPVPIIAQLERLEAEQLALNLADHGNEKAYLLRIGGQTESRLALLQDQRQKEEEGARADAADFERVKGLFDRGAAPITRVSDARRATLLSATRALETGAEAARAEREREDLARRLQKLGDQRRVDLGRELQEAELRLANADARLRTIAEKLVHLGALQSHLSRGRGEPPEIAILRISGMGREQIAATELTELLPGDVVEVLLKLDRLFGAPEP